MLEPTGQNAQKRSFDGWFQHWNLAGSGTPSRWWNRVPGWGRQLAE